MGLCLSVFHTSVDQPDAAGKNASMNFGQLTVQHSAVRSDLEPKRPLYLAEDLTSSDTGGSCPGNCPDWLIKFIKQTSG